jgi:predicted transcriptional regulator of viral defense system
MSEIRLIRQRIEREVFDYHVLLSALSNYSKPRDKITRLLAEGDIVRIKKGLYCFGEAFRREPVSREYLANLILGPSYVSLEYALSFHGLIPERVEQLTSVTTQRSRDFTTPLGHFSYQTLSTPRYAVGACLESSGSTRFLMASAEKAMADKVWKDKRFSGRRLSDYETYLLEDLRIDPDGLRALDRTRLRDVAHAYASPKIHKLARFIDRLEGTPLA